MILLDPDLGPDAEPFPARQAAKGAHSATAGSSFTTRGPRLPSSGVLARFLADAQAAAGLRGHVTVLLTTDSAIRRLNRRFRGKNKPTDVLSFPADTLVQNQEKGDLAISVQTAQKQAAAQGHSLSIEIKVLILHGLLHLAGYDHETDSGRMARRERVLRRRLGLPLGLIERAQVPTLSPEKRRKDGARGSRVDPKARVKL